MDSRERPAFKKLITQAKYIQTIYLNIKFMSNLGNGGSRKNATGSTQGAVRSRLEKRVALEITKDRSLDVQLKTTLSPLNVVTISELLDHHRPGCLIAWNSGSTDGLNRLKRYIHDYCRTWLKSRGFHVPASWGKLGVRAIGKITRVSKNSDLLRAEKENFKSNPLSNKEKGKVHKEMDKVLKQLDPRRRP